MKPRTVGFLGTVASAINCYFLLPALPRRPKPAPVPAPAPAPAAVGLPSLEGLAAGKLVPKMA
jgi:hypothetical protein